MSTKEHKELLTAFKAYSAEVNKSKVSAEQFLKDSGIHDSKGRLAKNYSTK
jgi:hypothetical protein